ncbi:MAG: addiction module toxin RelE [Dinghuibacter sp.]|nr:addiction module toxin RelE [Dinghuibacter sp.]
MKVTVRITKSFRIAAKPLLKKYHSLSKDLLLLEQELIAFPHTGTHLGQDVYKIRLKVTSKGKGKSGGARVISFVETIAIASAGKTSESEYSVALLTIYDKSDVEDISDKELKDLIKNYRAE